MSRCFALFFAVNQAITFVNQTSLRTIILLLLQLTCLDKHIVPSAPLPLAICHVHASCRSSSPTYCLLASQMSISTNVASDGDRGTELKGTNNTSGHDPLPYSSRAMPKTVPNSESKHRSDTPISETPSQFPAQATDVSAQSPSQTSPREPANFFNRAIYAASRPRKFRPVSIWLHNPRTHKMQNWCCWSVPIRAQLVYNASCKHETWIQANLALNRNASKQICRNYAFIWEECCTCSQSLACYARRIATVMGTPGLVAA